MKHEVLRGLLRVKMQGGLSMHDTASGWLFGKGRFVHLPAVEAERLMKRFDIDAMELGSVVREVLSEDG